jgi:hypothetical protein
MAKLRCIFLSLTLLLALQPTCSSPESMTSIGDAGSGGHPDGGTVVQSTGGAVTLAQMTSADWQAGYYLGPLEELASDPTQIVPWIAPDAGELQDFMLKSPAGPPLTVNLTVSRAPSGSVLVFSPTAIIISLAAGQTTSGDLTHSLTVAQGDCFLLQTDKEWMPKDGLLLDAVFIPAPQTVVPPT